jgi:hypothetical protein
MHNLNPLQIQFYNAYTFKLRSTTDQLHVLVAVVERRWHCENEKIRNQNKKLNEVESSTIDRSVRGASLKQFMSFLPGLPDGLFSNQKSKFWRALQWKMLVFFMDTWSILRFFCYILWTFGISL